MATVRLEELSSDELVDFIRKVDPRKLVMERREEMYDYIDAMNARSTVTPPHIIVRCSDGENVQIPVLIEEFLKMDGH